ncbi:MAG: hypothetical protein IPP49_17600 [Saprospiraceae bacterium]|nr:hypothetical protein [Saprospiraceae bacterium]
MKIIDQIFTNPLSVFQETNKVYYPYGIISYHISTGYERLIDPLSSTIKLKANFEENVGKNILNSIIWDVSNRNINITFYLRTGLIFLSILLQDGSQVFIILLVARYPIHFKN